MSAPSSTSAFVNRIVGLEQQLRETQKVNEELSNDRATLLRCIERLLLLSSNFVADVRDELARVPSERDSREVSNSNPAGTHPPVLQRFLALNGSGSSGASISESLQAAIDATGHVEEVMKSLQPFLLRCVQTASATSSTARSKSAIPEPSDSTDTAAPQHLTDDQLKEVWETIEYHHRMKLVTRMWASLLRLWRDSIFSSAFVGDITYHASHGIGTLGTSVDSHLLSPMAVDLQLSIPPPFSRNSVAPFPQKTSPLRASDVVDSVDVPLPVEKASEDDDASSDVSSISSASSPHVDEASRPVPHRTPVWGFDVVEMLETQDASSMHQLPVLRVMYVYENTCADAAGLRPGDTLFAVNEHRTNTHVELSAAMHEVQSQPAHTLVHIRILRQGKPLLLHFDPEGLGSKARIEVPSLTTVAGNVKFSQPSLPADLNMSSSSPQRTPVRRDLLGSYPISSPAPSSRSQLDAIAVNHSGPSDSAMVGKLNQTLARLKEIQRRREEILAQKERVRGGSRSEWEDSSVTSAASRGNGAFSANESRGRFPSPGKASPMRGRTATRSDPYANQRVASSPTSRSSPSRPSIATPLRPISPSPTRKAIWR